MREEAFKVLDIIDDTVKTVLTYISDTKLELLVDVEPSIPSVLIGDSGLIRRVMKNMVMNALKNTESGFVELKVSHIMRSYGANLRVAIRDTGNGFSTDVIERIFSETNENSYARTREIVEGMGGFLVVNSKSDEGTEVSFSVPLKIADETGIVSVIQPERIRGVAYFRDDKYAHNLFRKEYRKYINEFGNVLNVRYQAFDNFTRLKTHLSNGTSSHCFIGKVEYLENREYFDSIKQKLRLVVVLDYKDDADIEGVILLQKPFYSLAIARILNEEILSGENSNIN